MGAIAALTIVRMRPLGVTATLGSAARQTAQSLARIFHRQLRLVELLMEKARAERPTATGQRDRRQQYALLSGLKASMRPEKQRAISASNWSGSLLKCRLRPGYLISEPICS